MTGERIIYKTLPKEFKLEALRLMSESDRPASEIVMELGIRSNQLYKWKEQIEKTGDVSTGKKGRPKMEDQSELSKLRQELKRVKEENEILKKAAMISIAQCNILMKYINRCLKPKSFSWSLIQMQSNFV